MSENYTPSIEQLRTFWETHGTHVPAASAYLRIDRKAEFDRAIAAHDAELREQIAREIEAHGEDSGVGAYGTYGPPAITVSDAASIARGKVQA